MQNIPGASRDVYSIHICRLYTFIHAEHMNIRIEIRTHHGIDHSLERKHISQLKCTWHNVLKVHLSN